MPTIRWFMALTLLFASVACSEKNSNEFDDVDPGDIDQTGINDGNVDQGLPDLSNELPPKDDDVVTSPDTSDGSVDTDMEEDADLQSDDTGNDEEPTDEDLLPTDESGTDENTDLAGDDDDPGTPDVEIEWPDTDNLTPICTPNEEVACPYTGDPLTENVGPCKAGKKKCSADGTSWSNCYGEVLPAAVDICTDILDNDCNGTVNDGYSDGADGCLCLPNGTTSCYTGPAGTEGVGECHGGTKTCGIYGNAWGACENEVTPTTEICGNSKNDDCVGGIDDGLDEDGDGWTVCQNDCCDNEAQCQNPAVVNPGAVEVAGDSIDNDCNSQTDEEPAACSATEKFSAIGATDLLQAIGICKTAANGSWGIVGTPSILRADLDSVLCSQYATCGTLSQGQSAIDIQSAVMAQFGSDPSNAAIEGNTMAALSSGRARDNHNDPDPTAAVTYRYDFGQPPADFIAAHGGNLPQTSASCPASIGTNKANDSVMLTVQLKVPTNANSFSFNFRFFSQEYWSYTCQEYNDFFVTLLDTSWTPGGGEQPIPADKNISFDSNGSYISVNSTNFFTVCNAKTGYTCPDGTAALADTGYAPANAGATKWLSTAAPVVPGETITLRFVIWDTSDTSFDSLVLIDNFKWSAAASGGPITFECWDLNQNGSCDVADEDLSGDGVCNERDC